MPSLFDYELECLRFIHYLFLKVFPCLIGPGLKLFRYDLSKILTL